MSTYSICIPRVFANIRWKRVKGVFQQLGLGEIDRVDLISRTNDDGQNYQRCFIHFKTWADTESARSVREELDKGGNIKVIYDDPWFWKCFKSRVERPEQAPKQTTRRQPTIELEGGKIIRGAQRSATRKVTRNRRVQNKQSHKTRTAPVKTDTIPSTSAAADEFLAQLSTNTTQNQEEDEGPRTPPGSPTGMGMRMSPTQECSTNNAESAQ